MKEIGEEDSNYPVDRKDEKTVTCSISYHNEKPRYKIEFGVFGEERVYSDSSPSTAANAYLKACIRPFSEITNQMQVIRNKNFGTSLKSNFEDQIKQQFTLNDNVTINELRFTVNNSSFRIVYQFKKNDEVSCQTAIVRAIDYNKISRASYRSLAAIYQLDSELDIHIIDSEIIDEVENSIGKGVTRSIKDKVMIHYTLHIALSPLIRDLNDIKSGFIDKSGYKWNIKLYISADWKILSICLGHKSANSANFCLWCLINKSQNGIGVFEINNEQDNWTISKKIEDINQRYSNIPGHKYPPLFPMIPIQNWVMDELHLMLHIYD
ncbi:22157_t:CDS:2 [Gigaspora rosea]|nr:22157_t:CDS:2 [Gigaspora rosea]